MSIDNFRQFLDRSFRRVAGWVRAWSPVSIRASLPDLVGFRPDEAQVVVQLVTGTQQAGCINLSYHYRSLDCRVQVGLLEPTAGLRRIYQALYRPE